MLAVSQSIADLAPALFVLGALCLLLPFAPPSHPAFRAALLFACIALSWRYMAWRLSETVPPLALNAQSLLAWAYAALETLTLASSTLSAFILCRTLDRRPESDGHAGWWRPGAAPRVDIFIPTYNEEREILERTIAGAESLAYEGARIVLLDDGRRWWLRALCSARGIAYIARPSNAHAKAGNLNYAFRQRMAGADRPDFIAILDADFVPHRDFLARALALFHNRQVGLVQTPQCFFNPDPIQHNLGISHAYPDEQRFFFDHVQPSRDAWGIAACSGTSSIVRTSALAAIGGVPTESVTEDFLLSLRLSENGWKTVYLAEPLSEGLAPEGLSEYLTQRCRWCLGMVQIVRGPYNPLSLRHGLSLAQRISVVDSFLYWTVVFQFRLACLVCPLLYWYFGIVMVSGSPAEIASYFLPAYIATLAVMNWLSRGFFMPVIYDVGQIIGAWPIVRAGLVGLTTGKRFRFKVTPKGGDRSRTTVFWPLLLPFAALFALTLGGICLSVFTDYAAVDAASGGNGVILGWSLYNLVCLAVAIAVCFERPRLGHPMRTRPEEAELQHPGGGMAAAWVFELSADRAIVRGPAGLEAGAGVRLVLTGIGPVEAQVREPHADGWALALYPTAAQRSRLFARLHTAAGAPGIAHGRPGGILGGLARLLIRHTPTSPLRRV